MVASDLILIGRPSPLVLATLGAILGASLWVFATLVRRETRQRRLTALKAWAVTRNLRLSPMAQSLPANLLPPLATFNPHIHQAITGAQLTLAQFETADVGVATSTAKTRQWNVLVRPLKSKWPATALRPTAHAISLVDLFSLSSFPSLMPTVRFVVFGTEASAAQALAESSAPALLPADLAMVIYGGHLILDFSSRHFDEIEFDRLIDLAEQLAPRLVIQE